MDTGDLLPEGPAPGKRAAATGRGEHWWPVALVAGGLHVALPAPYRVNPRWVVPVVLLVLLAILIIGDPGRIDRQKPWLRVVTGIVIAFITLTNLFAAARLIADILTSNKIFANNPLSLAFWTATAFSPTDTSAIKPWAKLLMILEACVSLGLGALVIARAVNILKA
jgi:hypothetical protein